MKEIKLDMENVAIPEIHINGEAKSPKGDCKDPKENTVIDYSGAIPEYHPTKKVRK